MSFIEKIKKAAGAFFLKKELQGKERVVMVSNFETARSFGLLFDAGNSEDYELVKKYFKYLKENKKKVHAIGFFNTKKLPQIEYSKLDYDFFTKKELNWWGKPTEVFIKNFIEEDYDVLINFSLERSFPLHYIAALSKARFKIGEYNDSNGVYDLMITQPEGKNFKFFMRQIDHYLGIINKPLEENQ